MSQALGGLDPATFLAGHWQREPLLVRGAFPGFEPPIDANDLAGLACEPMAESRIIRGPLADGGWTLEHGPFEEDIFDDIGDRDWTLLVTDVEKHYPPLAELLAAFDFLPSWRLDDIMVSFAATGGSVGPHVDQYDVFLLQAEGRRRWEIAREFAPARRDDVPLDMLAGFEPENSWVLEPGDMLYLPPGVAHHGVALEPGLTYSIGLRAPSAADLLVATGEHLAESADKGGRYTDRGQLQTGLRSGEIDADALRRLADTARDALASGDELDIVLARFMSTYRLAHQAAPPPQPVSGDALAAALASGAAIYRNPWSRFNWIERNRKALLFASGERFDTRVELATGLCRATPELPLPLHAEDALTVLELLNAGHLVLDSGESD
ncbi:cupin domain-containing protein [Marinihelvus fidelis]|uniref:Cupin domain-containing protein n=1 Tax=Marinihelvus fidelis TaxID=2613842 RepID=A0A5N0TJ29_9GAMM|nr:cupin domain-containing protein [Marinihelvus fidelis]KAA9133299.1 cupin domain-containing protein [Marinihelvus fidelis]